MNGLRANILKTVESVRSEVKYQRTPHKEVGLQQK